MELFILGFKLNVKVWTLLLALYLYTLLPEITTLITIPPSLPGNPLINGQITQSFSLRMDNHVWNIYRVVQNGETDTSKVHLCLIPAHTCTLLKLLYASLEILFQV